MEFKVCISTDKGTVKEVNQDSTMVKVANTEKTGRIVMGALCDGMGGLSHGEVASSMMVNRLGKWFTEELPITLSRTNATEKLDDNSKDCDIIADVRREWMALVSEMNMSIRRYGMEHGSVLGTTCVSFLMLGNEFIVMNIGDSRVYMLTDKSMDLLTHDQSVVQDMIDRGLMTPQQAEESPQKSVLLQCIGASDNVMPQFVRGVIAEQTSILMCSDGFWRKLGGAEMISALKPSRCDSEVSMKKSLDGLVDRVKERGETDNISAILIDCII